jgi:hypothetical protein
VRASRELGNDRLDTSVGPLSVEVVKGLRSLRVRCAPNEWGVAFDLLFEGTVPALEEPKSFNRTRARITQDVSRYAQVGAWSGELEVGGQHYEVDLRPGRVRVTTPGACGRWRARGARDPLEGHGEPHDRPAPQLAADAVRRLHDQGIARRGLRRKDHAAGVDEGLELRLRQAERGHGPAGDRDHLPLGHARDRESRS